MNMCKSMELIEKYADCPNCGNEFIGNGQGGLVVEDSTFRRFCKCGFDITVDGDGEEIQKMHVTMLGETAYYLKHIEHNTGVKVSKLRRDISSGALKAYKSANSYYVIQSDLDKYLNSK